MSSKCSAEERRLDVTSGNPGAPSLQNREGKRREEFSDIIGTSLRKDIGPKGQCSVPLQDSGPVAGDPNSPWSGSLVLMESSQIQKTIFN